MDFSSQIVYGDPSSICSLGIRPIILQGFLLEHLRRHFADENNIQHDNLRKYLWRANVDRERIVIDTLGRWNPNAAGLRPAVLIRRNGWQVIPLGIGNRMHGVTNTDGYERYSVNMGGSHTIFCIATESGECEILASEIYLELLEFAQIIRERLDLLRFQITEIGQMQMVEESRQHFGIPITVAYAHNHNWMVKKHSPILNTVDISTFRP